MRSFFLPFNCSRTIIPIELGTNWIRDADMLKHADVQLANNLTLVSIYFILSSAVCLLVKWFNF